MFASHRAGQITFYEELGLAPGASPQEIREAFRALVRLLHPDQQTDPQLKDIAEKQMRKLNRIYAVLSDPERRRRYDENMNENYPPRILPGATFDPIFRRSAAKIVWVAAIAVSAVLLSWLEWESTPGVQIHARDQNETQPYQAASLSPADAKTTDESALIARLRSDLKSVTLERDAAIHEIKRLRGAPLAAEPQVPPQPARADTAPPILAIAELPSSSRGPALIASTPPRVERPPNRKIAGFWFYAPPAPGQRNKNQSLYPPEYIEATIKDENGMISGKYRARFQIVDRAISPDVNFTFTGVSTAAAQMTFPWAGFAGGKGEVTLKLLSENSLRIDWNVTEYGTPQGLGSGTAILTRRIE